MSITVNVVVEFVSLKEHVIKYEFLSLKNRYASIKLAHAQACKKEKKRERKDMDSVRFRHRVCILVRRESASLMRKVYMHVRSFTWNFLYHWF